MLRVCLVVFVALVHIAVLWGTRFTLPGQAALPPAPSLFSMINIETIAEKEAAPAPPQKRANATKPAETEARLAENFVEKAAETAETEDAAADTPDSAPTEPESRREESAAQMQAYVQKNYLYIQRRIQNALVYPAEARRTGVEGQAEADFIVCTDGSIRALTLRVSSGSILLDTAALEAVRRAAPFRPPAAELRIVIPVKFNLNLRP